MLSSKANINPLERDGNSYRHIDKKLSKKPAFDRYMQEIVEEDIVKEGELDWDSKL